MRKLTAILLVALLLATLSPVLGQGEAQAPEGTFYGAWPYFIPPDGHLNRFANGGPTGIGDVLYYRMVELPLAFYLWSENTYYPLLAEEWYFEGEEAFVVKLREDALWSDGTPITADDVVGTYAIGRVLNWIDYTYVDEVEKVDDYTIRFVLKVPSFLAQRLILRTTISSMAVYGEMAQRATELYESGATSEDQEWLDLQTEIQEFRPDVLLASGPYNYTLEDVGDSYMTLHWQPNSILSDVVNFGEIRIWYGETEAVTPLVLDGVVSYATHGFPPSTEQAFIDQGIRILRLPYYYGGAIYLNHAIYPWNVQEVRQAMAMAVDRAENSFLTKGLSARPVEYMAGFSDTLVRQWLTEDEIAQLNRYEYDPEAAAALLESIGFTRNDAGRWVDPNGDPVQAEFIFQAEWVDYGALAQNAVEQLNEFGFDVSARAVQWQQQLDDVRQGNFELAVTTWGMGSPFPADALNGSIRRWNYAGLTEGQPGISFPLQFEWRGQEVDLEQIVADSAAGLDMERQRELVAQAAIIWNDMLPCIPMNEILGNNPLNEALVSNAPPDDDPIWLNASSDHPITFLLLTGVLEPAQ